MRKLNKLVAAIVVAVMGLFLIGCKKKVDIPTIEVEVIGWHFETVIEKGESIEKYNLWVVDAEKAPYLLEIHPNFSKPSLKTKDQRFKGTYPLGKILKVKESDLVPMTSDSSVPINPEDN